MVAIVVGNGILWMNKHLKPVMVQAQIEQRLLGVA